MSQEAFCSWHVFYLARTGSLEVSVKLLAGFHLSCQEIFLSLSLFLVFAVIAFVERLFYYSDFGSISQKDYLVI